MEVVVALAILGAGIAALIELYSLSLRSTKKSADFSTAVVHARSILDEAYSSPHLEEGSDVFEYPKGFTARREVEITPAPEEGERAFYEIKVVVEWPPSGKATFRGRRAIYENE